MVLQRKVRVACHESHVQPPLPRAPAPIRPKRCACHARRPVRAAPLRLPRGPPRESATKCARTGRTAACLPGLSAITTSTTRSTQPLRRERTPVLSCVSVSGVIVSCRSVRGVSASCMSVSGISVSGLSLGTRDLVWVRASEGDGARRQEEDAIRRQKQEPHKRCGEVKKKNILIIICVYCILFSSRLEVDWNSRYAVSGSHAPSSVVLRVAKLRIAHYVFGTWIMGYVWLPQ